MNTSVLSMAVPGASQTSFGSIDPPATPDVPQPSSVISPVRLEPFNAEALASSPLSSFRSDSTSRVPSPGRETEDAQLKSTVPAKRRRLTPAEKEAHQNAQKEKLLQRSQEKARKEEQSRLKREEQLEKQRLKEEEKEKKRQAKAIETARKEEAQKQKDKEKKVKEDEKAKKERSQLRLNTFFQTAPNTASRPSSRRNSVVSSDSTDFSLTEQVETNGLDVIESEYEKSFPPFFLHSHTKLAQVTHEVRDELARSRILSEIEDAKRQDNATNQQKFNPKQILKENFAPFRTRRLGSRTDHPTVKNLISRLGGSISNPIDISNVAHPGSTPSLRALKSIRVKFLKFQEDVRPPYIGTCTKVPLRVAPATMARQPLSRELRGINYDYDSEAEWEEPEEGEELNSEGEEEAEDEDDEDMEGFLDDADAEAAPKRRHIMGDMEPISTGIHWESLVPEENSMAVPFGPTILDMSNFRIQSLLAAEPSSIDPYSTSYWASPKEQERSKSSITVTGSSLRVPLDNLAGACNTLRLPSTLGVQNQKPSTIQQLKSKSPSLKTSIGAKPFPPEMLEDFKNAIVGSDLTKLGLLEVLKKKFPQLKKNSIQDTLVQVARREGPKEAEKRWVLI